MNGLVWKVSFVRPSSPKLVDRSGNLTVATTDPKTMHIYLSDDLHGDFLNRVFVHELGHCAILSYGLTQDIHRMVKPSYWVEAEEWVCNFVADYGLKIFRTAYDVLGNEAWLCVPNAIGKFVS